MHTSVYTTCMVRIKECSPGRRKWVVPESSEVVMLSLRIPVGLRDRLVTVATESGVTIQSIGRRALELEVTACEALLEDARDREVMIRERLVEERHHQHEDPRLYQVVAKQPLVDSERDPS